MNKLETRSYKSHANITWRFAVYISKAMKKIYCSSQHYMRITWIDIDLIPSQFYIWQQRRKEHYTYFKMSNTWMLFHPDWYFLRLFSYYVDRLHKINLKPLVPLVNQKPFSCLFGVVRPTWKCLTHLKTSTKACYN